MEKCNSYTCAIILDWNIIFAIAIPSLGILRSYVLSRYF